MINLYKNIALAALLLVPLPSFAQEENKATFATEKLSSGIYMLSGKGGFVGGNVGLSMGEDGVVLIDNGMPSSLAILQTAIAGITTRPIDFLINTHVHGDHIGNNETMSEAGASVVAHKNLRKHLQEKGMQGKPATRGMLPVITFSKEMSFHLNGDDAKLIHVPNAHTDGDSVIYFEKTNIIHAGDTFFNGMFPFIDLNSGGSVDGFIAAQQRILAMSNDKTKIIPGHGPLATKKDLERNLAMLVDAKKIIAKHVEQNKSEEDVVRANPLAKYSSDYNWRFITTEKMVRQIYAGLTQKKYHKDKPHDSSVKHEH